MFITKRPETLACVYPDVNAFRYWNRRGLKAHAPMVMLFSAGGVRVEATAVIRAKWCVNSANLCIIAVISQSNPEWSVLHGFQHIRINQASGVACGPSPGTQPTWRVLLFNNNLPSTFWLAWDPCYASCYDFAIQVVEFVWLFCLVEPCIVSKSPINFTLRSPGSVCSFFLSWSSGKSSSWAGSS